MSEQTEKATPYKLQKAKEHGQVNKSVELNSCLFLLVMVIIGGLLLPSTLSRVQHIMHQLLQLPITFTIPAITTLISICLKFLLILGSPFMLAGILSVEISSLVQTGFVWTFKPLKPSAKKIVQMESLKRLFSSRIFFELFQISLKITVVSYYIYYQFKHIHFSLIQGMFQTPNQLLSLFVSLISKISLKLIFILLFFACIDKCYTRWKFAKSQRMSKQELKEEYKHKEGDPTIKQRMKQLQRQLRQKITSIIALKTADLIIISPSRIAIALKYNKLEMPAPQIICKAQGIFFPLVNRLSIRYNIPIVSYAYLAEELLNTVPLNNYIHPKHYQAVAELLKNLLPKSHFQEESKHRSSVYAPSEKAMP